MDLYQNSVKRSWLSVDDPSIFGILLALNMCQLSLRLLKCNTKKQHATVCYMMPLIYSPLICAKISETARQMRAENCNDLQTTPELLASSNRPGFLNKTAVERVQMLTQIKRKIPPPPTHTLQYYLGNNCPFISNCFVFPYFTYIVGTIVGNQFQYFILILTDSSFGNIKWLTV